MYKLPSFSEQWIDWNGKAGVLSKAVRLFHRRPKLKLWTMIILPYSGHGTNTIQYFIDTPHSLGFSVTICKHNQEIKVTKKCTKINIKNLN